MPSVNKAGHSLNDGMSNSRIITNKAANISIIKPANTTKYVTKYMLNERPFTLN